MNPFDPILLSTALLWPPEQARLYAGPPLVIDGREREIKAQILGRFLALSATPVSTWTVAHVRETVEQGANALDLYPPQKSLEISVGQFEGPAGPLSFRTYRPRGVAQDLPTLLYFHGGGMVIGSILTHDALCARLAYESRTQVCSLAYRLAPENTFPAALDDAQAAWQGLQEQAKALRADPRRLGVAGDSAGGNLAAALMHQLQAQSLPLPSLQVLMYPWVDLALDSPSMHSLAVAPILSRESVAWFRDHYLSAEADLRDPRLSPLHSPFLAGQPPAYLLTCGHDPLRDMGQAYAQRLRAAGVDVQEIEYPGQIHAFLQFPQVIPEAQVALRALSQWLQEQWRQMAFL